MKRVSKGDRKVKRARAWEGKDWIKTLSSGHDRITALTNPQQLWMPTTDPCKVKPVQHSNLEGRWFHKTQPADEKLLTVDGFYGRESQFSLNMCSLMGQPCSSG